MHRALHLSSFNLYSALQPESRAENVSMTREFSVSGDESSRGFPFSLSRNCVTVCTTLTLNAHTVVQVTGNLFYERRCASVNADTKSPTRER